MVETINISEDILSIFIIEKKVQPMPVAFQGTGFLIAPELLISCWHCLNAKLLPTQCYAAVIQKDTIFKFAPLSEIERDKNNCDLAFAKVPLRPEFQFKLAEIDPPTGGEIFTLGYPLTERIEQADGSIQFQVNSRYLRSYITRAFYFKHHIYGTVKSYELGMPAPEGLSGAPLVNFHDNQVVGVVYGNIDVGTIDQFSRTDPETGRIEPEIQRIVSFGLSHHLSNIQSMMGNTTKNMPLREYLNTITSK